MAQSVRLPGETSEPVDLTRGSVFFVGTATVVVRYAGFTILTDPNFLHAGDHAHLGYGVTAERQTDPAVELAALPPDVDFVLLSHFHGDHFDHVVQERLDRDLPIVTTHHAAEKLSEKGFRRTYPLETWEEIALRKDGRELTVTATPGRHGPPVVSKALPEVMGSMLQFREEGSELCRLYVSGDTVMHGALEEIPERYPHIDLALLHLGGTKIAGMLLTMDADQGVDAVRLFDADVSIPIHYDDYDVFESSLAEFQEAVAAAGLRDRVAYLGRGDTYEFEVPVARRL